MKVISLSFKAILYIPAVEGFTKHEKIIIDGKYCKENKEQLLTTFNYWKSKENIIVDSYYSFSNLTIEILFDSNVSERLETQDEEKEQETRIIKFSTVNWSVGGQFVGLKSYNKDIERFRNTIQKVIDVIELL